MQLIVVLATAFGRKRVHVRSHTSVPMVLVLALVCRPVVLRADRGRATRQSLGHWPSVQRHLNRRHMATLVRTYEQAQFPSFRIAAS